VFNTVPYCGAVQNAPVLLFSRHKPLLTGGNLSIKKDLGNVIFLAAIFRFPLTCTPGLWLCNLRLTYHTLTVTPLPV